MRSSILVFLFVMSWSCEANWRDDPVKAGPFVEELESMESCACEVLGLSSPVKVVWSGPCRCGHSRLELTDSIGTKIWYGCCYSRIGKSADTATPIITTEDCHTHNPVGDLLPGSTEELAIQILAGIWLRNQFTEISARLLSMNIRQPVGPQGEVLLVVRPLSELVDYREEARRLGALDFINERFSKDPERFWAFRYILCNDA